MSASRYLGDQLVRVGVPVVLDGEVGRDGCHVDADVRVLDAVALRKIVHDGLRLGANNREGNNSVEKERLASSPQPFRGHDLELQCGEKFGLTSRRKPFCINHPLHDSSPKP